MEFGYYLLIGALWIATCVFLGLYILGKGLSGKQHFTIGLSGILASYLLGLGILVFTIITS